MELRVKSRLFALRPRVLVSPVVWQPTAVVHVRFEWLVGRVWETRLLMLVRGLVVSPKCVRHCSFRWRVFCFCCSWCPFSRLSWMDERRKMQADPRQPLAQSETSMLHGARCICSFMGALCCVGKQNVHIYRIGFYTHRRKYRVRFEGSAWRMTGKYRFCFKAIATALDFCIFLGWCWEKRQLSLRKGT